jgi:orotidine-5'-phosphate decarboxylase
MITQTANSIAAVVEERVIIALDVDTADEARTLINELRGEVAAFKIGLQLFTAACPDFVREVAGEHRVFLDLKFHDIPNTVAKASVEATRLGVWMFNVHSSGGGEMMRATVRAVDDVCAREDRNRPVIIGVTVLTSSDANTLRESGIERAAEDHVLHLARLTAECGLDGVVASPMEIAAVRKAVGKSGFLIVTPGVRPEFATKDDQKRVMTPRQAVLLGSDYLVIGRPVLRAEDRVAALRKIREEMVSADK